MGITNQVKEVLLEVADKRVLHHIGPSMYVIHIGGQAYTFVFSYDYCVCVEYREQDTLFSHTFVGSNQKFFAETKDINGKETKCVTILMEGQSTTHISKIGIEVIT